MRLHDRPEQQRGDEGQQRDEEDGPDEQDDEDRRVGAHRPEAGGVTRLPTSAPATASATSIGRKRPRSIDDAAEQVGEGDRAAEVAAVGLEEAGVAGERRAVVVGLRRVGVQRLGEALRARR